MWQDLVDFQNFGTAIILSPGFLVVSLYSETYCTSIPITTLVYDDVQWLFLKRWQSFPSAHDLMTVKTVTEYKLNICKYCACTYMAKYFIQISKQYTILHISAKLANLERLTF
jgi:hypothetical protein